MTPVTTASTIQASQSSIFGASGGSNPLVNTPTEISVSESSLTAQGSGIFAPLVFATLAVATLLSLVTPAFRRSRKLVAQLRHELEQKELELTRANEQAQVADLTKTAFLANMSHEIRTPLGVVLGFTELLVSTEMSTDEKQSTIEAIQRNGVLLANVINDILDLSKVESGRLNIDRAPTALQDVIRDLHHLLAIEAAEKGLQLHIRPIGMLPKQFATDALRLRQVLQNVIGNAIKFTNKGLVEVTVAFDEDNDGKLAFQVRDTGSGIEARKIQNLFFPFAQGDVTSTRQHGGTGLGLVLSKKLSQAMGGDTVLIESRPGVGSVFRVSVDPGPRETLELVDAQFFKSVFNSTADTNANSGTVHLPEAKVLLVEDSLDNQVLISRILRSADVTVEIASNGREGVEFAMRNSYDLIFMDLQMPVLDGYGALAELRAKGYLNPVIALTAHAMKEEIKRCLECGFNAHLSKPIDRPLLFATLVRFVEAARALALPSSKSAPGVSLVTSVGAFADSGSSRSARPSESDASTLALATL